MSEHTVKVADRSTTTAASSTMVIGPETSVLVDPGLPSAVVIAARSLCHDLCEITGRQPRRAASSEPDQVRILEDATLAEECYRVEIDAEAVTIRGHGLGIVYGIYHFSTHHLGIDPYAAWTGVEPAHTGTIELDTGIFDSAPHPVRHRAWFVNDEDCLRGMSGEGEVSLDTWQLIFETMLRTGWNTVIAGTGLRPDDPQLDLAYRMGLWVTQHHSEPLGARLYTEEYPSDEAPPHPLDDPTRYQALYRAAIDQGAHRRVLWTLGLRGQGDEPFLRDDGVAHDPAEYGALLTSAITAQKQLVEEKVGPGQRFLHYLYSESAELYRSGHLQLDADILPVWSDNGFGAMRVRREWGAEPNLSALPAEQAAERPIGIYYHVSFHDLQAAGLLVPHVHPVDIVDSLRAVTERAQVEFFVLNVGCVRPHLYPIDLITNLLRSDDPSAMDQIATNHLQQWSERYFPRAAPGIAELMTAYYDAAFQYGEHHDERAGDEFYHNTLRRLIATVIKGDSVSSKLPFMPKTSNREDRAALEAVLPEARRAAERYEALDARADDINADLSESQRSFFLQSVWMPIRFMELSSACFVQAIEGLISFVDGDFELAFRRSSRASRFLEQLWTDLTSTATGRWRDFYRGEWLVDVRETRRVVRTMQGLAVILGDTDHRVASDWTVKAFGLSDSLLSPNRQASCDYDRLGWALDRYHAGDPMSIEDLLESAERDAATEPGLGPHRS